MFLSVVELQPASESVEVCSGAAVHVNCTTGTDYLLWRTTANCQVPYHKDDTHLVGDVEQRCNFEALLLSTSPSLLSTATFRDVNSSHNGTILTCLNTVVPANEGPDQMASISIVVGGNIHHKLCMYRVRGIEIGERLVRYKLIAT